MNKLGFDLQADQKQKATPKKSQPDDFFKLAKKVKRRRGMKVAIWGPEETRRAWVAAIVDCEGTIGLHHHGSVRNKYRRLMPVVVITNSSKPMLDIVTSVIGKPTDITERMGWNKMVYRYRWAGLREVYKVLRFIHPYLIIKKKLSTLLIMYIIGRWMGPYKPYNEADLYLASLIRHEARLRRAKPISDSLSQSRYTGLIQNSE